MSEKQSSVGLDTSASAGKTRGIELDFFEVQVDYSKFQVQQRIWCHFRCHNRAGAEIEYDGIGIAVHKWTGQEWAFHYYRHSYAGKLSLEGGPAPGGRAWRDNWKADGVATFALTPFLTFDKSAKKRAKRRNPTSIGDGHFMGKPVYVKVGSDVEPGGVLDKPPAPLFPKLEPEVEPEPPEPVAPIEEEKTGPFKFKVWPTVDRRITQKFGARPDFYKQFGFPGHEGIDLASPFGTPYMAVAAGKVLKVSDKRWDGKPSAYGWHVVLEHREGYSTLYAHAKPEIPVAEGQEVAAGQILAYSGNTGNSSGPHLHLTLKKKGYQLPGWRPGYMDPYDLLRPLFESVEPPTGDLVEGYLWSPSLEVRDSHLAVAKLNLNMREQPDSGARLVGVVKAGTTARILDDEKKGGGYIYCEASIRKSGSAHRPKGEKIDLLHYIAGDGRIYEVKNEWGGQERFQTQWDGTKFFQTKNRNWEEFFYDNDFIYRDVDTSPGAGRYYRLKDADRKLGSRWVRRHMAVGESYTQTRHVQFYRIENCAESSANSGNVKDTIKLVAHHKSFECRTGFKLNDVIELLWVNGGEKYFYAKDYGLVAWERTHDDPNTPGWSGIAEEHRRGARPDNQKLAVGCL